MEIPWNKRTTVVAQNLALFAINKPSGLLSHPNKPNFIDKNAVVLANYDAEEEAYTIATSKLYLLNRLDSPTSGLMLLSDSYDVATAVRAAFKTKNVSKTYDAVVYGDFASRFGQRTVWVDFLKEESIQNARLRVRGGGSSRSETAATLIERLTINGITLSHIELSPKTGRTHQLRVQCSLRGMPIIGDKTYGNFRINKLLKISQLLLHSSLIHIKTQNIDFSAQLAHSWQL